MMINDTIAMQHVFDGMIKQLLVPGGTVNIYRVKAVIRAESRFNPVATSHCGARGLMQTMPATDKWIDGNMDGYDVWGNVNDGIKYLEMLYGYWMKKGVCSHVWEFIHGSYNAGQGNIRKCQRLLGDKGLNPDIWQNVEFYLEKITGAANSRQTVDYVRGVLTYYSQYEKEVD